MTFKTNLVINQFYFSTNQCVTLLSYFYTSLVQFVLIRLQNVFLNVGKTKRFINNIKKRLIIHLGKLEKCSQRVHIISKNSPTYFKEHFQIVEYGEQNLPLSQKRKQKGQNKSSILN